MTKRMSEASIPIEAEKCYFCLEEWMVNGKEVGCGHQFCLPCIIRNQNSDDLFLCPVCRTEYPNLDAAYLPSVASTSIPMYPCTRCKDLGVTILAVVFCENCELRLCTKHEEVDEEKNAEIRDISWSHADVFGSRHNVLSGEQMMVFQRPVRQSCPQHGKELAGFCLQCDKILCLTCNQTKDCTDGGEAAQHQIGLFEEIIPNVKKDLNLQLEELRNCIARLDRHETEAQLKAKSLEDHVESMRKQVAVMLSEEIASLCARADKLQNQLTDYMMSNKNEIASNAETLANHRTEAIKVFRTINKVLTHMDGVDIYTYALRIKEDVRKCLANGILPRAMKLKRKVLPDSAASVNSLRLMDEEELITTYTPIRMKLKTTLLPAHGQIYFAQISPLGMFIGCRKGLLLYDKEYQRRVKVTAPVCTRLLVDDRSSGLLYSFDGWCLNKLEITKNDTDEFSFITKWRINGPSTWRAMAVVDIGIVALCVDCLIVYASNDGAELLRIEYSGGDGDAGKQKHLCALPQQQSVLIAEGHDLIKVRLEQDSKPILLYKANHYLGPLCVDKNGLIYVSAGARHCLDIIYILTYCGGNLRTVGELLVGQTCHITDIDVEEHKLVVSNFHGALVHVFELISDSSTE